MSTRKGVWVRMHRTDGLYAKVDFLRTGRLLPDPHGERPGGGGYVRHDSGEVYGWSADELEPFYPKPWHFITVLFWRLRRWVRFSTETR